MPTHSAGGKVERATNLQPEGRVSSSDPHAGFRESVRPGTTTGVTGVTKQPTLLAGRYMSDPTSHRPASLRVVLYGTALALALTAPGVVHAQDPLPEDSTELLEMAHELQKEFEEYRESRTPVNPQRDFGGCDENIGRICIWFGGDEEERFPSERPEVGQARVELIRFLTDALEQVSDRWIFGQLVHYLAENRNVDEAERIATECGIRETWWCDALRGYVLHIRTEYVLAEAAFRDALDAMPESEYERWITPTYVLTKEAEEEFKGLSPLEQDRQFELFWRLSDPLFLFEGNDRLTDHFARLVVAINRQDARHPQGMEWGADMEETLVRYGRNTGYSRTQNAMSTVGPGGGGLRDTRRMVGHHHPKSRGYIFPEEFLESPSDIPAESWITAPREARTWYAPPYAPDIRGLETQVGRFRDGDNMLVIGAYRPTFATDDGGVVSAWGQDEGIQGDAYAAFFLVPEDGSEPARVQGSDPEGVLTIVSPPGRYVSGLEVVDLEGRQGWRARQGVVQLPLTPGLIGVSDLLILREGAELPETLDEAIPNVRPGVRLRPGERFPVVWEVYGLGILEPIQVTIGFSQGRPGFLTRVGEFLGVIEPDQPVDITFADTGPDRVQAAFRSIELELPNLEPGEYTLHLRLDLFGRTPVIASRPIIVEG
jgi:hypothetical protein